MARLNLVIGDSDEAYLESLACFLIRNYYHRFLINSFTKQESLGRYLSERAEKIDILLIEPSFYSSQMDKNIVDCILFLSQENITNYPDGIGVVNKYQHGDKLVGSILNSYSEKATEGIACQYMNKKTRVISVFSPQGGSGKTCVAMSSCIQCVRRGMKVFYLNLEDFNSSSIFFECNDDSSFSDIIYYLKEKSKNLAVKIEALKCIDPIWGIHYFSPPESDVETAQISFIEIKELIEQMVSSGIYDFIILDTSSNLGDKNVELLKLSDKIALTIDRGLCSKVKLERFIHSFEIFIQKVSKDLKDKLIVVLNRCNEYLDIELEGYLREFDFIMIPEVENLDKAKIMHMTKMDSNYIEAIDKLIQRSINYYSQQITEGVI